jgi:uncharacterized protein YndB with AHSA1/START domain
VLHRVIDVPPFLVWRAWTEPEHLKQWFTPKPWKTVGCEIDLRPGGLFKTVMQSPEGQDFPYSGCYLEVAPQNRLVWTSALLPGYRPNAEAVKGDAFPFTCILTLEPQGTGTNYTAIVQHGEAASKKKHEDMGFFDGWGAALTQLVEYVKTVK